MRLFVLGATGRTGLNLIDLGLARGHSVTAFVRSPNAIARSHDRLTIIQGDPHDAGAMAAAMVGHDAVLSALGPRNNFGAHTLLRDCAASTVSAMQSARVSRVIVVSAALAFPGLIFRIVRRLFFQSHIEDVVAMERVLEGTTLDWTIVRPPRLIGGQRERYRWRVNAMPPFSPIISWRAVANCLLDLSERAAHVREVVGISW